jgi:hypothetical protein
MDQFTSVSSNNYCHHFLQFLVASQGKSRSTAESSARVAMNAAEQRLFLRQSATRRSYEKVGRFRGGKNEALLDPVETKWASKLASSITAPIVAVDSRARRSRGAPDYN